LQLGPAYRDGFHDSLPANESTYISLKCNRTTKQNKRRICTALR
jgi:hypothetical protein